MNRTLLFAFTSLATCLHAEVADDLLRFGNGDQLHGQFQGIAQGPNLIWKRNDLDDSAKFGISELRHLVLRGGNPADALKSISLVELVNGDQIPGIVTGLNDKQVVIETGCAGTLTLDRNKVARIAPQPLGGRLHYHGPFSAKPWDVVSYSGENNQPQQEAFRVQQQAGGIQLGRQLNIAPELDEEEGAGDNKNENLGWQHSGAAWYWKDSQPGSTLILRDMMPRRCTLRFDVAWKSQLNMAIAIHADFCNDKKDAKKAEEAEAPRFVPHDSSRLPAIFGNAFVLQVHSNYMVVYRTIVDNEGNSEVRRVNTTSNRLEIGENSVTNFELRSDLENSIFSLFVNGKFVTQWTDPVKADDKKLKPVDGRSLAFLPQIANAQVKLSDVIIAEWNGMPDSARSLQTDDQDIILMTNGLDRMAGKAIALEENGMLRFKGKHGEFLLPLEEVSELHMATDNLLKFEPQSEKTIKIRFSPMGVITGIPLSGDRKAMVLRHPLAGEITINNDAAVMLEFDDSNEIFTDWDAHF